MTVDEVTQMLSILEEETEEQSIEKQSCLSRQLLTSYYLTLAYESKCCSLLAAWPSH